MDYSTIHFGKTLSDITIQDVEAFFQEERGETDKLEFKSINHIGSINDKFSGIQRSVCAFLNSSGGLIIWGAPEGKKVDGKHEKVFKGPLTYFGESIEKDYVVSKLSDSITPLPNNIRVRILENDSKPVVVIEVDTSEYSPHQTSNVYYMRIDGQTKPAPHHYIEALFKKIRYPNIEVYARLVSITKYDSTSSAHVIFNFVNWSPLQNEEKLSVKMSLAQGAFYQSFDDNPQHFFYGSSEYRNSNVKDVMHYGAPVQQSMIINIDNDSLATSNERVSIAITFGGRYSPMKVSLYDIKFSDYQDTDPSHNLICHESNKLVNELHKQRMITKEKIIESFTTPW